MQRKDPEPQGEGLARKLSRKVSEPQAEGLARKLSRKVSEATNRKDSRKAVDDAKDEINIRKSSRASQKMDEKASGDIKTDESVTSQSVDEDKDSQMTNDDSMISEVLDSEDENQATESKATDSQDSDSEASEPDTTAAYHNKSANRNYNGRPSQYENMSDQGDFWHSKYLPPFAYGGFKNAPYKQNRKPRKYKNPEEVPLIQLNSDDELQSENKDATLIQMASDITTTDSATTTESDYSSEISPRGERRV